MFHRELLCDEKDAAWTESEISDNATCQKLACRRLSG